ncbi:DUF192 domain-containing protein [Thermococcus gorgonarius]|uniref:UPF0127 protein A3K92_03850 n=1 Tax=Thermococcus gorgonarius TaxID=71997 RepID=A0A2Z2MF98_THEGO|nr:DUF192 domain-containing protein [Thermococcus gorgonarius]ASJ00668.1 hypothetical protein A3K92_03850 [Thermococcus gorgonarius]
MIINETKGKEWPGTVKVADSFLKRFRGLMMVKNIGYALVFYLPSETRVNAAIHTFFMLEEIDVIWLDSSRKVVDFRKAKKWRLYSPKNPARYIIEGPVGLIKVLDVEEGDLISWYPTGKKRKAVPVKSLIPGKIDLSGSGNGATMIESVKEVKVNSLRQEERLMAEINPRSPDCHV